MSVIQLINAEDLKMLRKKYNLTQKNLAIKAGVSQSLISRIENKNIDPRLSTIKKIYNAILSVQKKKGTAKDIMHSPVITINALDNIRKAIKLMNVNAISQLPVVKNNKVIGSVKESTLIKNFSKSKDVENYFSKPIYEIMDYVSTKIKPSTSFEIILELLLNENQSILVMEDDKLYGIITKIDVLSSMDKEKLN